MKKIAQEILSMAKTVLATEWRWKGALPKTCQVCETELKEMGRTFFYAQTLSHKWHVMCKPCFDEYGSGLGEDDGQEYDLRTGKLIAGAEPSQTSLVLEYLRNDPKTQADLRYLKPEIRNRLRHQ